MIRAFLALLLLSTVAVHAAGVTTPAQPLATAGSYAAPSSVLTSSTATALTSTNNFIASSVTAASVVTPFLALNVSAMSPKINLTTNASSGWGGVSVVLSFWNSAPTYANGDGSTYAATTGSATLLDQYTCTFIQFADKAQAICVPNSGSLSVLLPPNAKIYWDLYLTSASATKSSGQTFTLTPFIVN